MDSERMDCSQQGGKDDAEGQGMILIYAEHPQLIHMSCKMTTVFQELRGSKPGVKKAVLQGAIWLGQRGRLGFTGFDSFWTIIFGLRVLARWSQTWVNHSFILFIYLFIASLA
jgi:hypothetical protein